MLTLSLLKKATILAVDDDAVSLTLLSKCLAGYCHELLLERLVSKAFVIAAKKQPDIILLDVVIQEINGYEVCQRLKSNPATAHIPVIFVSALMRADDKIRGFEMGAVDYICKPFNEQELRVRIESCLKVHAQIRHAQQFTIDNTEIDYDALIKHYKLSAQELTTLRLYASGYKRSDIAGQLAVSENTVKWYLKNIFDKLEVENRSQVIAKAREIGVLVL
ncbi:MAG: DNA-binding response regulator [Methylococcaceae bacterium]